MRRIALISLAVVCSSLFACSGQGQRDSAAVPTRTPAAAASASGSPGNPPEAVATIDQQNLQFVPATISVKTGQVVLFTNSDSALHMIKVDSTIVAGTMKKGDTIRWTAPTPGQYTVTCDYHPQMSATITVTP